MNKQVYENVISKSIFKLLLIIFILTSSKTASAQDFSSAMSINVNTYMQGNVTSGRKMIYYKSIWKVHR